MDQTVQSFVDAALARLRRDDAMRIPIRDMPESMRDPDSPPQDDWIGWRAIPSTVTDAQLDDLEREISLQFPPGYREFLKYRHFYELDCPIRFARHPSEGWQDELRKEYRGWEPERIIGVGLIPFAEEAFMDAGPICFDTRHQLPNGDCPVVLWDHEWVGTDKEIQPLFSSGDAMFRCLEYAARSNVDIFDADEPGAKRAFETFLALDPDGAAGPAREYWNAWTPEQSRVTSPKPSTSRMQYVSIAANFLGLGLAIIASSMKHVPLMIVACALMVVGVVLLFRSGRR